VARGLGQREAYRSPEVASQLGANRREWLAAAAGLEFDERDSGACAGPLDRRVYALRRCPAPQESACCASAWAEAA
jgi:hypothetical protein